METPIVKHYRAAYSNSHDTALDCFLRLSGALRRVPRFQSENRGTPFGGDVRAGEAWPVADGHGLKVAQWFVVMSSTGYQLDPHQAPMRAECKQEGGDQRVMPDELHPVQNVLELYFCGHLANPERALVESHLLDCRPCRLRLHSIGRFVDWLVLGADRNSRPQASGKSSS